MHNWNIYHLYPATVLWFISDSGSRWRGDNGWGDTDGWERGRYPQMCWLSAEIESGPCQSWSYQPRHSYSWLGPTFNNESNNRLLWLNCVPSQAHHKYQGWSLIRQQIQGRGRGHQHSGNQDWEIGSENPTWLLGANNEAQWGSGYCGEPGLLPLLGWKNYHYTII